MAIDPRDPDAVARVLREWAEARFGGQVAVAGSPVAVGAGFDSFIHLVDLTGDELPAAWRRPLVVRLLPSIDRVEQAHREATVQGWVAASGVPGPARARGARAG